MKLRNLMALYIVGALMTTVAMVLACPPEWDLFWYGREIAFSYKEASLIIPTLFGGGVLLWSVAYALTLKEVSQGRMDSKQIQHLFMITIGLVVLLVLLPPVVSNDTFYYYQHGWMVSEKDVNPYITTAASFADVPGVKLTKLAHADVVTPYSPLWVHISSLIVTLSNGSFWAGVFMFKLLAVGSMLACVFLVRHILRQINPAISDLGFVFIATNPLIILETASTGHNDIVAIATVLAGVWLMLKEPLRPWLGLVVMSMAILVKVSAAPAVVLAGLWACRDIWTKKLEWQMLAKTIFLTIALFAVVIWPFWNSFEIVPQLLGISTMSGTGPYSTWLAPALLAKEGAYYVTQSIMETGLTKETVNIAVSIILAAVTILSTLYFGLRSGLGKFRIAGLAPVYLIGTVLQVYWRQWYVLWPAVFISLAPRGIWVWLVWCYCTVALLSYLVTRSSHVYCCYS